MAKGKSLSNHSVLGLLDKTTRLVVTSYSFNIEVKVKTDAGHTWVGRYYYSDISSAVRGYAKYRAKKAGKKFSSSKDLLSLLELVSRLDKTIENVGIRLEKAWLETKKFDPVEANDE